MANENEKQIDMTDDIENSSASMKKRWILTINNPIFTDTDFTDEDISKTDLEVVETHFDLSILGEDEFKEFFEYHYIKWNFEKENAVKIIKRPFFKNYDCVINYFKALKEYGGLKYAVGQYERGEENGTPHIQAFVVYKNSKRFKNVKQDFPTARIKEPNGSNMENRDYCTKKRTRLAEPFEIGEFSEMRSRNDIVLFHEAIELGATNLMLKKLFPVLYSTYGVDKIEKFRQDILQEKFGNEEREIKVTYIYGATRLGKTTFVLKKYPYKEICRINNYKQGTFENYKNQKVLILDEFTGKVDITLMNNILDKYPLDLPARFQNRTACYTDVYIVSNLAITDLYKEEQTAMPEVFNAFTERIHEIIKFTALGKWHYEKQTINQMTLLPENTDLPL